MVEVWTGHGGGVDWAWWRCGMSMVEVWAGLYMGEVWAGLSMWEVCAGLGMVEVWSGRGPENFLTNPQVFHDIFFEKCQLCRGNYATQLLTTSGKWYFFLRGVLIANHFFLKIS